MHHAALKHRGGAVRVARLLLAAQLAAGLDARLSYEIEENDPETLGPETLAADAPADACPDAARAQGQRTHPAALARRSSELPPDGVTHLHTSSDWPAMLEGLLDSNTASGLIITLHDATVLTGGCAYPLDCPHFPACADPCPRQFPQARLRQAHLMRLLKRLEPVLTSPSGWLAAQARAVLPDTPVRVIPNGVPWPDLATLPKKQDARAALGIAPGAKVVLFAAHGGERAAYKSGAAWPEFFGRIASRVPGALGFAAGGDEAATKDGLTIWPYLDRARLALLMRAADCLVYPTLADNHPLVLLEAAALELPVVAFSVGGVPEIVSHGITGLLAPAGHTDALVDHAVNLLSTPALARTLGHSARDQGGKRFGVARMAAAYQKLLGG
jgi:glycosyltransferase involved in cell wall biosynthesis